MSPQLYAVIWAAALLLGGLGLGLLILLVSQSRGSGRMQRRLSPQLEAEESFDGEGGRLLAGLAARGRRVEQMVDTSRETPRLLVQAGWRSNESRALYYAFQILAPLIGLALVGLLWLFRDEGGRGILYFLAVVVAVIVGLLLPRYVLRRAAERRRRRINAEVPLFIHLLVLLFEAGLSTRQAIASLVREGQGTLPELGREFELVLRQLEAGGDTAEVLKNLGDAMEVADLTAILSVLRQVDRYGGEVREPLLEGLQGLEQRRSLDTREKVNLTAGRMTVVMVLFFFPALLIFVAGPAFVAIIKALGQANS